MAGAMANRKRHADAYCPRDDEWNREIRSAFSKMRRKYRVSGALLPSVSLPSRSRSCFLLAAALLCGTIRDVPTREMTMPIRLFWKSSRVYDRRVETSSRVVSIASCPLGCFSEECASPRELEHRFSRSDNVARLCVPFFHARPS